MRISKLIAYDIRHIFMSGLFYVSLTFCLIPPIGFAVAIQEFGLPTAPGLYPSMFFSFFASILVVINALMLFTKDISHNTIVLLMNEKKNRTKYFIGKTISMAIMGLLFGIVCVVSTYALSTYANLYMPDELWWKPLIHFVLYTLFYGTLFFMISLFITSVLGVITFAILSIMILPTMLQSLFVIDDIPEWLLEFIDMYLPLYFLPDILSDLDWSSAYYISTSVCIVLFIAIGIFRIRNRDY